MDQRRLFLAIAISVVILLGFQFFGPHKAVPPPGEPVTTTDTKSTPTGSTERPNGNPAFPGTQPLPVASPTEQQDVPRLKIVAPKVEGSIALVGARFDDLVLRDYHEEVSNESPLVRLLEPRSDPQPYFVQYGWTGEGVKLPSPDTLWTASENGTATLAPGKPVTLSWDNGAGQVFQLIVTVDDNYMFSVEQKVQNNGGAPVTVFPWSRIRRDYKPLTAGYYILHEGMLGVLGGTLQEQTYDKAKTEGDKTKGPSLKMDTTGGWAGITDKYWLTAMIPDQKVPVTAAFRHLTENGSDRYQVDFVPTTAETIPAGAADSLTSHLFAGAKVVQLLDRYESEYAIPNFDKAVDFGWFYFLTKPIFYALDFFFHLTGNFGVAIMLFTVIVKGLFFPLASKSYRSMSKMKLLAPKMKEIRERLKDEPQKMQAEIMQLYKAEKVNPASGCLPMVVQIPVFFSLYKVIFVTIEMRHAPFFGWIHDLSSVDPTNVFTLFGLIPWDPSHYSHFLHLGLWSLILGCTMFLQQKLNPPPPDPVQAKIFQFMPIIFTFMMSSFPAGLVIYWSWNNTLTILQQWTIMRQTRLPKPELARP